MVTHGESQAPGAAGRQGGPAPSELGWGILKALGPGPSLRVGTFSWHLFLITSTAQMPPCSQFLHGTITDYPLAPAPAESDGSTLPRLGSRCARQPFGTCESGQVPAFAGRRDDQDWLNLTWFWWVRPSTALCPTLLEA